MVPLVPQPACSLTYLWEKENNCSDTPVNWPFRLCCGWHISLGMFECCFLMWLRDLVDFAGWGMATRWDVNKGLLTDYVGGGRKHCCVDFWWYLVWFCLFIWVCLGLGFVLVGLGFFFSFSLSPPFFFFCLLYFLLSLWFYLFLCSSLLFLVLFCLPLFCSVCLLMDKLVLFHSKIYLSPYALQGFLRLCGIFW